MNPVASVSVRSLQSRINRMLARMAPPLEQRSPLETAAAAGLDPDPWQIDLLLSRHRQTLVNASRQSGKSTTTATLATHTVVYEPGSLVLLLSPSLRQSSELFRKCLHVYRALGRPVPAEAENVLSLDLANGSRIVSLPGREETIRGYSGVDLLIADEASRIPDELIQAVRPMLAVSGGRLVAMSTPFGRRGWWHQAWIDGAGWERIQVTAHDCPRIPADWLEEERRSMPAWVFAQEYECVFGETDDQVFSLEMIDAAITDRVAPLFPGGLFRAAS